MPSGVQFVRSEIADLLPIWLLIRDAIEGETAIKGEYGTRADYFSSSRTKGVSQARKYLPQPNPTDRSSVNLERYKAYVQRAVYYNFSKRTLDGLVGQIFLRPPVVKKPAELNVLDNNADGRGLELVQLAKRLTQSTLSFGRAGFFVDYPRVDGPVTVAAAQDQNIQPTMVFYYPWQVINWATRMVGAKRVLSLVVIEEIVMEEVDGYEIVESLQYRALRLDDNNEYFQEIHAPTDKKKKSFTIIETIYPKDSKGQALKEIPFQFIGSEANDHAPDQPPMYDLCSLNIAHYRNSADYEESCFMVGQPTPVVTGITEHWVKEVLGGTVQLGSRATISLPEGASAMLLQAAPNQMPEAAMRMKEEQALSLGAKLVQKTKTVRTATEVMVDTTSETSILHSVADNVSAGMEQGLRWCAAFVGAEVPESTDPGAADNVSDNAEILQYRLNTEFELTRMTANDRLAVLKMWQSGAIAFEEMRDVLKVDGTVTMNTDDAWELIQAEQAEMTQNMGPVVDPFGTQETDPNSPTNTPPPGPGGVAGQAVRNAKKRADVKAGLAKKSKKSVPATKPN